MPLLVRDVMTSPVQVLRPDAKLSEARGTFEEGLFHHLPVVGEDGGLLGLVSASDLLKLTCESYGVASETMQAVIDRQFHLSEVMVKDVITIAPGDTVRRASSLLAAGSFHALPVVDSDHKLIGMVTSSDLIGCLLELLSD